MKNVIKNLFYIALLVVILIFISVPPSFSGSLKFVHLSDTHYSSIREDTGYKLLSKSGPLMEDAISQINAQSGIDFVVITGDVIDQPRKDSIYQVTDILNKINYPWYYVVGNHDTDPTEYVTKKRLIEILKDKNRSYKFNSTYYTFKPKRGFRVIVLDGAKDDKAGSSGIISAEELSWLDHVLAESEKDVVLIFIHFPLIEPFESPSHRIKNADDFKSILNKYKMPIGIFSGHYHATKITKHGNILHVSTPSLVGYPNAFRIVTVKENGSKVEFKMDFFETGLKDLQAKTKIMTLGGKIYYGKPSDRDAVITMDKNQ